MCANRRANALEGSPDDFGSVGGFGEVVDGLRDLAGAERFARSIIALRASSFIAMRARWLHGI